MNENKIYRRPTDFREAVASVVFVYLLVGVGAVLLYENMCQGIKQKFQKIKGSKDR